MDDLVPLAIMEGAVLFCSDEDKIMLDWLRAPDPRFLDDIKNFVNRKFQCGPVQKVHSGLGEGMGSACLLKEGCPRFRSWA